MTPEPLSEKELADYLHGYRNGEVDLTSKFHARLLATIAHLQSQRGTVDKLEVAAVIATTLRSMLETPIETPIERPSIDELERILNAAKPAPLRIRPDGSVVEIKPCTTTIKTVAIACAEALAALPGLTGGWRNAWQPIHTIPDCDDLLWLCRGDTFEGPRAPQLDDADYWDWWCYAKPPSLPKSAQPPTEE